MKVVFAALVSGLVFGLGLTVSQMISPEKVLAFLDIAGNWDPSLGLVMASALAVTGLGYRLVMRRPGPVLSDAFQLPEKRGLDRRLLAGSTLFGIGWGLSGLCPGPAITALATGLPEIAVFSGAMFAGIVLYRVLFLAPANSETANR